MDITCQLCQSPFPASQERCPHCGRPSLFPNVTAASLPVERAALDARYSKACLKLEQSNCDALRQDFELAVRDQGKAVISTNFAEVERIAATDSHVFSTYYQRVQAGLHIPTGGKWDVLRGVAEHALFPGYKDHIRFGALSLHDQGVWNYGQCAIVLKNEMVTHRTTLFEDNNVVFTVYEQQMTMAKAVDLEPGHRAVWGEREKLCVAKLAPRLEAGLATRDFPDLLLESGLSTRDDRFVELHIWGPLTVRAIDRIRILRMRNRPLSTAIKDLQRLLQPYQIDVEVQ